MTELDRLTNQVGDFIEKVGEMGESYFNEHKRVNALVDEQRMGVKEAREQLANLKEDILANTKKEQETLLNKIVARENKLTVMIAEQDEPVTSDVLAELQLLETMEVDETLLKKYSEKYKNNSLATRKIREIANKNNLFTLEYSETPLQKELETTKRLRRDIDHNYYNHFKSKLTSENDYYVFRMSNSATLARYNR